MWPGAGDVTSIAVAAAPAARQRCASRAKEVEVPDLPLVLALSSTGEEAVMATTREHGARDEGRTMSKTTVRARANARELGDVPTQLAALEQMNVGQLAEKYRELYGEPTRTRNKEYLRK